MFWAGIKGKRSLQGGGVVSWKGVRGAHLKDVVGQLREGLDHTPYPTTVIIHAGTNDILKLDTYALRNLIPVVISSVRNMLPLSRIIWSDILPRRKYKGELKPGKGKQATNFANCQAHKAIYATSNASFICYSDILSADRSSLYRKDGTHLSRGGLIVFKMMLGEALLYFRSAPNAKAFPPSF